MKTSSVLKYSKIWDVSPEINESIAVFPGDVPFQRRVSLNMKEGAHLTLSAMTSTLHLGAHADGPNHYDREGGGIETSALEPYFGPCSVIEVNLPKRSRIAWSDEWSPLLSAPRILFKTNSFDPHVWSDDFIAIAPEVLHKLADLGVVLVGIDTPSVDLSDDKVLLSHQVLAQRKLSVLEGLDLRTVPEGYYQLIALPLKIKNGDASPVRAILLK